MYLSYPLYRYIAPRTEPTAHDSLQYINYLTFSPYARPPFFTPYFPCFTSLFQHFTPLFRHFTAPFLHFSGALFVASLSFPQKYRLMSIFGKFFT